MAMAMSTTLSLRFVLTVARKHRVHNDATRLFDVEELVERIVVHPLEPRCGNACAADVEVGTVQTLVAHPHDREFAHIAHDPTMDRCIWSRDVEELVPFTM